MNISRLDVFLWPIRVYYEDTDNGGVVYYANYLKFMERARTEWLRSMGFEQDRLLEEQGVIFAVRSVNLEYLRPARFNEQLFACVQINNCKGAVISFDQHVVRFAESFSDGDFIAKKMALESFDDQEKQILCSGQIQIVCLDGQAMRPRRIPHELLTEIT